MAVRTLLFTAAASAVVLTTTAGCGATRTATATAASAAPLSPAWYASGAAPAPTIAAAQIAPGAYRSMPVPSAGTGLVLSAPVASARPGASTSMPVAVNCGPILGPATSIPVTATAATGTITAHWNDLSDPAVLTYRIAAVPNYGAPTRWLTVAATHTCNTVTTTIGGLARNTNYEVWLDAVHTVTAYGVSNVTQETMIGRSLALTVH